MCRKEGCIHCLCSNEYEDLDEESQKDFISTVFNLHEPTKVVLTFFETVADGIIKSNDENEIIIQHEGGNELLCNLMEFAIGFKSIKDNSKSIKLNEVGSYIANLPD